MTNDEQKNHRIADLIERESFRDVAILRFAPALKARLVSTEAGHLQSKSGSDAPKAENGSA
jgi:hypothetical protein